jgi:uncharacterized protein YneF (UPF0154 family)
MGEWWVILLWILLGVVIGGIAGFFIARKALKSYLDKNPPVNEKMIRAMFTQMGRKPSEAQVRQVMNSMKQAK